MYELEAATEEEESMRATETALGGREEDQEGYVVADVDDFDREAGSCIHGLKDNSFYLAP